MIPEKVKENLFTFREWISKINSSKLKEEVEKLRKQTRDINTYKANDEMFFWEILLELRKRNVIIENPINEWLEGGITCQKQ